MIQNHNTRSNLDIHTSTYTINDSNVHYCLRLPRVYSFFEESKVVLKYGNIARYYRLFREIKYEFISFKLYANSLYFNPKHSDSRIWWFV